MTYTYRTMSQQLLVSSDLIALYEQLGMRHELAEARAALQRLNAGEAPAI